MNLDRPTASQRQLNALLSEYCERIEQHNAVIKAVVPDSYDRQRIIWAVDQLFERWPDPAKRPALFGLTLGVKDIIRVDGFATSCGTALPEHLFRGAQADSVSRLLDAGMIVMAKTETTEFAFLDPAPTRNPHNVEHTPGGSSSGSAAGVAKGFFDLALGTQTVGSVIRPAAYCGVTGFKPTLGRISTGGVIPFSSTVDQVGLFCADSRLLQAVAATLLARWDPSANTPANAAPLAEAIVGIPEGPYLDQASNNGLAQFRLAMDRLRSAGTDIRSCRVFPNIGNINRVHQRLIAAEMARSQETWFAQYADRYRPHTREIIESGQQVDDAELHSLLLERQENIKDMTVEMEEHGIDFWLAPSAVDHADPGLKSTGSPIMNLPWTHAGMPVVSLPTHLDERDLPHGLQVIGKFDDDERLLPFCSGITAILGQPAPLF
jgi:Asp-tRNA(Asn)/Glu-tRNA(Gln) amidotransferase A subunit family amidase